MKGSPGLEMRELRPASGRGGSDMGRAGLCLWAPVSQDSGSRGNHENFVKGCVLGALRFQPFTWLLRSRGDAEGS